MIWEQEAAGSNPRHPDQSVRALRPPAVERALAHIGHSQGRRACYLGTRKNLFGLRRAVVVHNLHIIARQPTPAPAVISLQPDVTK